MGKKLVYIDIGTHIGQEYNVLFTYSTKEFLFRFFKIFLASFIFNGNKISFIGLHELRDIIKNTKLIRCQKKDITTILVEPNARLYKHDVYSKADKVFCLALGDLDGGMHFSNLFFPNSDKFSQGATIFETKKNIDSDESDDIVICGCDLFAQILKDSFDSRLGENSYEVVIRVNCEGSEDNIIYAFHKIFKNQFNLIMGSLKDVAELKGSNEMEALWSYIDTNSLKFVPFSTLITTWKKASEEILYTLKQ